MARGQRKPIEEKIQDKESLIESLKTRLASEQRELEELKQEKEMQDVKSITVILNSANISVEEAREIIEAHVNNQMQ